MRNPSVIITGASSGIGRATALAFAAEGSRVALASRNAAALAGLVKEIEARGGTAFSHVLDVTDKKGTHGLVQETVRRFGRVDIVVCNAGQYIRGPAESLGEEDFERAMAVNFYGSLHLIYAVLPGMIAQGSGHIVAVSSVDGKKGLPLDAAYVSSKFALTGFMDVLRQELHGSGVHCTTVLPGRVDTPMIDSLSVPLVSPKISPDRVARSIVRGVRRKKAEVIVPALDGTLVILNAVFPAAADWLVRLFRLEGRERSTIDQRQKLENA